LPAWLHHPGRACALPPKAAVHAYPNPAPSRYPHAPVHARTHRYSYSYAYADITSHAIPDCHFVPDPHGLPHDHGHSHLDGHHYPYPDLHPHTYRNPRSHLDAHLHANIHPDRTSHIHAHADTQSNEAPPIHAHADTHLYARRMNYLRLPPNLASAVEMTWRVATALSSWLCDHRGLIDPFQSLQRVRKRTGQKEKMLVTIDFCGIIDKFCLDRLEEETRMPCTVF
jgi:hypothetical protein